MSRSKPRANDPHVYFEKHQNLEGCGPRIVAEGMGAAIFCYVVLTLIGMLA